MACLSCPADQPARVAGHCAGDVPHDRLGIDVVPSVLADDGTDPQCVAFQAARASAQTPTSVVTVKPGGTLPG